MPDNDDKFEVLVTLLTEVKPGIADRQVKPEDSVVDDLGLDSLDLLQLSRKIPRRMGVAFDLDSWTENAEEHHRSVASILTHLDSPVDA
jgi:acyl carrier protein